MQKFDASGNDSFSKWIVGLRKGEDRAAARLWERFYHSIRAVARNKLGGFPRAVRDEEDLALSVLVAVFRGAQEGRFQQRENRNDFWQLAKVNLSRKASNSQTIPGRS